ncbi:hypothetical protein ACFOD9_08065 [Novosphingobium bradum]|uniref:Uncharacterized protein n=1 Tax=Novosphingobium bradum TaxID=1737444 RepID=A0ABV7ITZ0_9SPHN
MSHHPTTFAAEPSDQPHGAIGWDDPATLHRRADGGGLLHGFKAIRKGTLGELVRWFAALPAGERGHYMIEKAGDRQYHPFEIMGLAARPDLPAT